jgi:hypothetical protein
MQSAAASVAGNRAFILLSEAARSNAPIIWLVLAYAVAGLAFSAFLGQADQAWPILYVSYLLPKSGVLLAVFVLARLLHAMVVVRPPRLIRHVWWDFTANPETHRQLAAGLPLVILLPLFLAAFAAFKVLIPELNFYHWDETFAIWDRLIHGSVDPWRILQPVLGHPIVTYVVNLLYGGWFAVMQVVCLWQAFSLKRPRLRLQFLTSFILVWIVLGSVGATLLSSVGPCFYGLFVDGADPYRSLMDYLHGVDSRYPLLALQIQDMLWHGYLNPEISIVRGISAMPSIHVSIAFLMALFGWRVHRVVGAILTAFFGIILIGSVHLGWHYAVDGYLGIAGTYVIWRVVGWVLARRQEPVVAAGS